MPPEPFFMSPFSQFPPVKTFHNLGNYPFPSVSSVKFDSWFLISKFVHVRCAPIVVKLFFSHSLDSSDSWCLPSPLFFAFLCGKISKIFNHR